MRSIQSLLMGVLALLALQTQSFAQFGVCDRAANDAVFLVNRDADQRIAAIFASGVPPYVANAQITIINYSRNQSLASIDVGHQQCVAGYEAPQQIVDTALNIYTFGINSRLGPTGHVDVSEILNGRPLGGPGAIVPQAREQILGGDNGTGANIIRDPIGCVITFTHKC